MLQQRLPFGDSDSNSFILTKSISDTIDIHISETMVRETGALEPSSRENQEQGRVEERW